MPSFILHESGLKRNALTHDNFVQLFLSYLVCIVTFPKWPSFHDPHDCTSCIIIQSGLFHIASDQIYYKQRLFNALIKLDTKRSDGTSLLKAELNNASTTKPLSFVFVHYSSWLQKELGRRIWGNPIASVWFVTLGTRLPATIFETPCVRGTFVQSSICKLVRQLKWRQHECI